MWQNPWRTLGGCSTPASLSCHLPGIPGASEQSFPQDPEADSNCAQWTSSPKLPLLSMRQTLGQRRGLCLSLRRHGDHALERDGACLTSSVCAEWPALASLGCPPLLPRSAAEPPVSFHGCHCPLWPLSGPKFLWLVARPLAAGEGWTSGRKDTEAPAALQVLLLYRGWAEPR